MISMASFGIANIGTRAGPESIAAANYAVVM
jgi:hypothetical protein